MIKFARFLILISVFHSCGISSENETDFLTPSSILIDLDSTLTSTFFDRGSWFGVNLPPDGFGLAAPLLLSDSNGYTFRAPILTGTFKENGKEIVQPVNSYLPGSLIQTASTGKSDIRLKSIYPNHNTLLLAYQIRNRSSSNIQYSIGWTFPEPDSIVVNTIHYDLGNALLAVQFQSGKQNTNSNPHEITVEPNSRKTFYLAIRHRFREEPGLTPIDFSEAPTLFIQNNSRWAQYMEPYQELPPEKRMLASKCIQTLVNNWRSPAGELKFDGLFPSYDYKWFHGFWSWDSWKHSVALVSFEPELAKEQVRTMYHFQDEYGMIADVVYRDTLIENHNWRDTKPPLSGWAIHEIFNQTKDTAFVKEMLPKLMKYHEWWYENRDHNDNGLCEFGSTDGTRVAAGWESGMDNAVRFDDAKMIQVDKTAWSLDQESVDLNAYLFKEKKHISYLLTAVDYLELAETYQKESTQLKNKLQTHFYDPESNYFYDFNTSSQSLITIAGPEAWTTLWSEAASTEQADGIVKKITNPDFFNTQLPFPTLSASHQKFDPENGYWRGPVWVDQVYFALSGMQKYGYEKEYGELMNKVLENAEGLLQKGIPIRENYDPRNGKGLNANHFSWSAAHILMLLKREAKVR